ncbi:type I 3-dehydroquinase-domain-containing protein [Leucosporidium creatinivorum]|uniref:shikimate kinase n=1 Tax=Leucosporidium creatinivorum TaxID=106004 RepID=A0A1Y2FYN8_9BASI|nr:type I 3-dehydroquinase-domain-containing protein [Leucosporidium creatinivorum]
MVHPPLYDPDATVALIGMRGVGKTTLGLIAATSLRRSFIDADSAFQTLHGPISAFVNNKGWAAFRDAESIILRKLFAEHPKGVVIACGGGVVEREENRELLKQFRDDGHPIVHVVRDKEETIRYLVDEAARPAWGEEIRHVWARRTPFFESLCTHTIVSLTAYPPPSSPQFLMKHVETAFVRLLRSIFGLASSHVPLIPGPRPPPVAGPSSGEYGGYGASESELGRGAKGPRTLFVAFNFPDLRIISGETIRKVAGGVDVIELRVDTFVQSMAETPPDSRRGSPDVAGKAVTRTIPSPHFVALCFGHLRRCSPLPILYTVRTTTQGGVFPDPYTEHPELMEEYLALVELGFKLGSEYIDLELGLPDEEIKRLLQLRGAATQCLGAAHDVIEGVWRWNSQEVMDKYLRAANLGFDIIKLVSRPAQFSSNLELLKFRERVTELSRNGTVPRTIPLLAINIGKGGQISRYLNPVFTPVTHPLLPGVAAPGQLTYAQTQQALFLSGLILEKTFFVPCSSVADTFSREAHSLGLPYTFIVEDRLPMRDIEPNFGGAFLGRSNALPTSSITNSTDDILPPARSSGWIDLVVPRCTEPDSYDTPPVPVGNAYKHTNVRVLALAEIITQNLSPINAVGVHTSALLVGLGAKDRAEVLEALSLVGARWVFLYACEEDPHPPPTAAASPSLSHPTPHHPPSTSTSAPAPSRAQTPQHLPYPLHAPLTTTRITSFSSPQLYARRPPTIIISSEGAPAFPEALFVSPTGGCAMDLSGSGSGGSGGGGGGKGELWKAIEGAVVGVGMGMGRRREGWQMLGPREVLGEVERQAFKALTGRRMG